MGFLGNLLSNTPVGAAVEGLKLAGGAVSNIMDRFIPKKMSEAERWTTIRDQMTHEKEIYGLEIKDVNKAREMYITLLRTQKLPWFIIWFNAAFRPFAAYMSVMYIFDKVWSQWLVQVWPAFVYIPIERDPIVDGIAGGIIGFFFGFRGRAKEKGTTLNS